MLFRFRSIIPTVLLLLTLSVPANAQERKTTPTTVRDTVEAVLRNHRALKTIQENREVIVHELRRAKAGWGPRVDLNGRAGTSQLSNTTTRPLSADTDFYGETSVGATLTQPLWDGFATRSRVRSTEATLDSMTSRVLDNATSLGLDGIIAHIDVLRRREIFRLSEENVRRHKEILTSAKDRESMGADTMADVTQTEGRLSRALSTLSEAKASLLEGEANYRRLTDMPLPKELAPVEMPVPFYESVMSVFEVSEKHNPKLAAYLSDIRAAEGEKELAESAYHPVINLEAGPSYTDRRGPGNQWTKGLGVAVTGRWNIFNSGADEAEVKAAMARVRQAQQVLYNFRDDLALSIQETWVQYQSAMEQYKHYQTAIKYNTMTRDAYLEQFMIGQRSLLDVLDSENELFNSSTQAVTARGNILVGAYRLAALTGLLLNDLKIDTKDLYKAPDAGAPATNAADRILE